MTEKETYIMCWEDRSLFDQKSKWVLHKYLPEESALNDMLLNMETGRKLDCYYGTMNKEIEQGKMKVLEPEKSNKRCLLTERDFKLTRVEMLCIAKLNFSVDDILFYRNIQWKS